MKKSNLRIYSVLLCLVMVLSLFSLFSVNTYAASQSGVVINVTTTLNVRSGPGTSYSIVGSLKNGVTVAILSSETVSGVLWYKITTGSITGYVHSSYLQVIADQPSGTFEEQLTAQRFPESYKQYLRQIHVQYPNWVFTALHTNLDWNTVITAQSSLGRNLVPSSSADSWKSFEAGAYNWTESKWVGMDGANWVAASKEIIAYYIDPRNSLNTTNIFQFESLSYSSHHSASGVQNILKNTFMSGSFKAPDTGVMYSYADTFVKAGQSAGVSPYHLASRARQEQGVNGGQLAHGTVPGYSNYFNFFNIGASPSSNATSVVNGAKYATGTNSNYYLPWTNQYKSILGGAVFLGSSYIAKGQNTLYLQKFDVVDGGNGYHSHQYMTNLLAPTSESTSMKNAYSTEMLNSTLVFEIPVYLNMPSVSVPRPSTTGNNNNWLYSMRISGQTYSPSFYLYTQTYSMNVAPDVWSINIDVVANNHNAKVEGAGTVALKNGSNVINIVVTATSGVKRTYTLNVYKESAPLPTPTPVPSVTSSKYRIEEFISGVAPKTASADFLNGISVKNGTCKLVNSSRVQKSGYAATGDWVQIYDLNGKMHAEYSVVIYGDVNGDGMINSVDISDLNSHLANIKTISGVYLAASDVNKDKVVNNEDVIAIQEHVLRTGEIVQ